MNSPLTGKRMTGIFVLFFGVVIAVNVVMACYASSTFGGIVVENSYVASQDFNRWLDEAAAEKALAIWQSLGDSRGITRSLVTLGITAMLNNDYDRAQNLLTQALTQARTLNEDLMIASILNSLAGIAIALQDWQ